MLKNTLNINIIANAYCNKHCPYCYSNQGKIFVKLIDSFYLIKLLSKLKPLLANYNVNLTLLGGGEIALLSRSVVFKIISSIYEYLNLPISIVTHGMNYNERLVDSRVKEISVSIHDTDDLGLDILTNNLTTYYNLIKAKNLNIKISLIITNPMAYTNKFIKKLISIEHMIDRIEVVPIEKTKTNSLHHFTYKRMYVFLKALRNTKLLKNKVKMPQSSFTDKSIWIANNSIYISTYNNMGYIEFLKLNDTEINTYLNTINKVKKCLFCKYMNKCISDHPREDEDCSIIYKCNALME